MNRSAALRFAAAVAAALVAILGYAAASAALVPNLSEFDDVRHHVDFTVGIALPLHVVWQAYGGWALTALLWSLVAALALAGAFVIRALTTDSDDGDHVGRRAQLGARESNEPDDVDHVGRRAQLGARGTPLALVLVLVQCALLGALLAVTVTFSGDVYAYVIFGRLYGLHAVSPYLLGAPLPDLQDPVLRQCLLFYGNPPPADNYGPLWTLVAGLIARIEAGASLAAQVWTHRALACAAAVAATCGLLYAMRAAAVRERVANAAAFALHPLVLYEAAVGGHNDLMMIAPAVWAFALADELPLVAGLLMAASISVKYVSAIALPFLILRIAKRNLSSAALAALVAVAVPVLFFQPFWAGPQTMYSLVGHGGVLAMSPQWLVDIPLFVTGSADRPAFAVSLPLFGQPTWPRLVELTAFAAFCGVLAVSIVRYARNGALAEIWRSVTAFVLSLSVIHPWYVTWLLPAAARRGRWGAYAWWFGMFAFLRYALDGAAPAQLGPAYVPLLAALTAVMLAAPAILCLRDTGGARTGS